MSVDCLSYLVKHMLANEEPSWVFLLSLLHCTSLWAVLGPKFTLQRPIIKMRWPDLGFRKKIIVISWEARRTAGLWYSGCPSLIYLTGFVGFFLAFCVAS